VLEGWLIIVSNVTICGQCLNPQYGASGRSVTMDLYVYIYINIYVYIYIHIQYNTIQYNTLHYIHKARERESEKEKNIHTHVYCYISLYRHIYTYFYSPPWSKSPRTTAFHFFPLAACGGFAAALQFAPGENLGAAALNGDIDTMWCPQTWCERWFINPIYYSYIYHKP
jgi:hypothetical protein